MFAIAKSNFNYISIILLKGDSKAMVKICELRELEEELANFLPLLASRKSFSFHTYQLKNPS